MSPLLETVSIVVLVLIGVGAGWWLARADRRVFWAGVALSLATILAIAVAWEFDRFAFHPWVAGLFAGRNKLVALALAAPVLQVALLRKLRKRSERVLVGTFLTGIVARVIVFPVALSALVVPELARLHTFIDTQGVCLQGTQYTCGPASAVTILRRQGLDAQESDIAILARTNPMVGTDPDLLANAIGKRFGRQGFTGQFRRFDSIDQLRPGQTIAVIKFNAFMDHCVAVLEVTDTQVITGDPLMGVRPYWRSDFEAVWRHQGIVVRRV